MKKRDVAVRSKEQQSLPVFQASELIVNCCTQHSVVVIVGETGTGKSTQVPQYLMERRVFGGRIAVTQPRRVAATSLAARVASERKVKVGTLIGYTVRFDDMTSKKTRLRYMTDGMLLREAMLDPSLNRYSVIVLDEAHERSLGTDILLGIVKRALEKRKQTRMKLRVVIMSATLDIKLFLDYFTPEKIDSPFDKPNAIYIKGRQHKVDVLYANESQHDYIDAAIVTVLQIHLDESRGDILVFLTGQEEIESCVELLEEKIKRLPASADKLLVLPMFAALPAAEQMKIFEKTPADCRKVVLATNIAETSITISGISFVVDTGMVKTKSYSSATGLDLLKVGIISQEQAWQRCGRAGREGPGKCFRLYREDDFLNTMKPRTSPEIKRVELSQVVLQLLVLDYADIREFGFIEAPSIHAMKRASMLLMTTGAVEIKQGVPTITPLGKKMAALPLEPMHAKFLIESVSFGCTKEALIIASMLSVESPFFIPRNRRREANEAHARYASYDADHLTLLNVFNAFVESGYDKKWCVSSFVKFGTLNKALKIKTQLTDMLVSVCSELVKGTELPSLTNGETEPILQCLVSSFTLRTAQRLPRDGANPGVRYKTQNEGMEVRIHPSSSIARRDPMPEWIVFNQLVQTSKKYIKDIAVVNKSWLVKLAPKLFQTQAKKTTSSASRSHDVSLVAKKRRLLMCD